MSTASFERLRKAALTLHGLSRQDQVWLLRRLLPAMRMPLQALLRQLRGLGIAPDMAPNDSTLPPAEENIGLDAAEVTLVDGAGARRVATVLAHQPEQLQAVLLMLRPWQWRADYWHSLSAFQRSRMSELWVVAPKLSPAMLDALLHGLAQALSDNGSAGAGVGLGAGVGVGAGADPVRLPTTRHGVHA